MRSNAIFCLIGLGGSIVLTIFGASVKNYESILWASAAACFISAFVLAIWPVVERGLIPATKPTNRYMTAYEALHYLADDSSWGRAARRYEKEDRGITFKKNALLEAPGEFKRIAAQGSIRATGILNGQSVQIPETYWELATLDPSYLDRKDISNTSPAIYSHDRIPIYEQVKILREDIERAWPRPVSWWPFGRSKRK